MIVIHAKIVPGRFIGSEESGEQFFAILDKHGFLPDKIGHYEPIREPYSLDRAIVLWADISRFEAHIAGGMLGKKKKPNYTFMSDWAKGEKMGPGYITFFIAKTTYKAYKDSFESMYRELFNWAEGIYGYISHEVPMNRQHTTGNIETRMPGVFYCNYFGQLYVDFFEKEHILSGPWTKTEVLETGTVVTYLSDDPNNKEIVESDELEMMAQHHLGIESFGDLKWEKENLFGMQIRKVPKIVLPTINVPID